MHCALTIIRRVVSRPAIIMDDSVPCGHFARLDIKLLTWISSAAVEPEPSIDHINDSKGKEL